jgi:hypothetical protein
MVRSWTSAQVLLACALVFALAITIALLLKLQQMMDP